jgi:hypothetical protein
MQKTVAQELKNSARICAEHFSNPDRGFYQKGKAEFFEVFEIIPLSEYTATVVMKKDSGKKAVLFFYYIKSYGQDQAGNPQGKWFYFFPSDSHILGMSSFKKYKDQVEVENFKYNFEEVFK